jgi:hypothetical protein
MEPLVSEYDLINIERYNAYARLLVDNQPVKPFNFKAYPPIRGDKRIVDDIKEFSRWKYGVDRRKVEAVIIEQAQLSINHAESIQPPAQRSM